MTSNTFLALRQRLRCIKTFHELQADLLYPPKCASGPQYDRSEQKQRIVCTLAIAFYNRAEEEGAIHKHHVHTQLFETLQVIKKLPEKSAFAPTLVTGVNRVPWTKTFRQIPSRQAGSQNV